MTNIAHYGVIRTIGFTFVDLVIINKDNHPDGNILNGWIQFRCKQLLE